MNTLLIDLLMLAGGLLAGLAMAAMCGLGVVVWLAGDGKPLNHSK